MSAHVMEGAEDVVFPEDQEERETDNVESEVVAWFIKAAAVSGINPCL